MSDSVQDLNATKDESRERLFRLTNRLSRNPGDLEVIKDYVEFVLNSESAQQSTDKLDQYDRLESFLLGRAGEVNPDQLSELVRIAETIDERRQEVIQKTNSEFVTQEADQEVLETLRECRENGVDTEVPSDHGKARAKLERYRKVRSANQSRNGEAIAELGDVIAKLETAVETDQILLDIRSKLQSAENSSQISEAGYILQSAEQHIGQLVTQKGKLGEDRKKEVEEAVKELHDVSRQVSRRQREAEDRRRWDTFMENHGEELEELLSWSPPSGRAKRFKPDQFSVQDEQTGGSRLVESKTSREPRDELITPKIQRIQELLVRLNEAKMEMQTSDMKATAEDRIDELEEKLNGLNQRREQTYNEFAMRRIRRCLEEAENKTGTTWNDKEGIADALVKYLGDVDQRFLTSEVGRCYSEVFGYLYDKLKRAKSNDDFEEEGRKLNALKRMNKVETLKLADL